SRSEQFQPVIETIRTRWPTDQTARDLATQTITAFENYTQATPEEETYLKLLSVYDDLENRLQREQRKPQAQQDQELLNYLNSIKTNFDQFLDQKQITPINIELNTTNFSDTTMEEARNEAGEVITEKVEDVRVNKV